MAAVPPKVSVQPQQAWERALGLPGTPETRAFYTFAHPLKIAITGPDPERRAQAREILEDTLREVEGVMARLAEVLGCSYMTAHRMVEEAELREYAGTLRLEYGHPGPTGHGPSRGTRQRSPGMTPPKTKPRRG